MVSEEEFREDPQFAAAILAFVHEIRRISTATEIHDYLDNLERTIFLAPPEPGLKIEDLDDEMEDKLWHDKPVMGAEESIRFSRAQHLLLP